MCVADLPSSWLELREAMCQPGGNQKRSAHPCNTGLPAESIEQVAKHGCSDKPSAKIACQIQTASDRTCIRRGTADEACCDGLREKRANSDEHQSSQNERQTRADNERQSNARHNERHDQRSTGSETRDRANRRPTDAVGFFRSLFTLVIPYSLTKLHAFRQPTSDSYDYRLLGR
jgi:hypothetical protein